MTSGVVDTSASRADRRVFPADFVWGVATSSFQIEGSPAADGKGPSIWDTFCRRSGSIADGSTGDVACDHYNRAPADVALLSELGIAAYRFSVSWPRVVPAGVGAIASRGLDFYDRLVDLLLAAEIEPVVTLYHWDLPQGLEDEGGWLARGTARAFADYAEVVVERLGDRVTTWTTLNEPFVSANHGYLTGEHAPGRTSVRESLAASHHLLLGHGLALERIRAAAPAAEVGIVLNFTPTESDTDSAADLAETRRVDDLENRWYVDPIGGLGYPETTVESEGWDRSEVEDGDMDLIAAPIDVLGVNFYTRQIVSAVDGYKPERPTRKTDMGWEIHPSSFGNLLRTLHERHAFPKYLVTENGCAMPDEERMADGRVDDLDRIQYLHDHLVEVHDALTDGVPITGYFAWSFMDNFEWAHGYAKRFGLVEVDFETLERLPKRSGLWYSAVAATGAVLEPGDLP